MSNVDETNLDVWAKSQADSAMRRSAFDDAPLHGGGGGGTYGGMDAWQASIDRQIGEHRAAIDAGRGDYKDLLKWFGGAVVLLLVAFASGFLVLDGRIASRFDKIDDQLQQVRIDLATSSAKQQSPQTPSVERPGPKS